MNAHAGENVAMESGPLAVVHDALSAVMRQHVTSLTVTKDDPGNMVVESSDVDGNGKRRWFGAVQTKKNYVSYHLMPVYENPALLDDISPELRARMQGKSCFNFRTIDDTLFAELGRLTGAGATDFAS